MVVKVSSVGKGMDPPILVSATGEYITDTCKSSEDFIS